VVGGIESGLARHGVKQKYAEKRDEAQRINLGLVERGLRSGGSRRGITSRVPRSKASVTIVLPAYSEYSDHNSITVIIAEKTGNGIFDRKTGHSRQARYEAHRLTKTIC